MYGGRVGRSPTACGKIVAGGVEERQHRELAFGDKIHMDFALVHCLLRKSVSFLKNAMMASATRSAA